MQIVFCTNYTGSCGNINNAMLSGKIWKIPIETCCPNRKKIQITTEEKQDI